MRTFLISYVVLSVLAIIGAAIIFTLKGASVAFIDFSSSLAFYLIVTPLVFFFVNSGLKGGNNYKFFNYFYAAFGVKMFLALAFALIYIITSGHKGLSFGLSFGGLYVAYTGIETFALVLASQAASDAQKAKQI
jgi:hypothetical protein